MRLNGAYFDDIEHDVELAAKNPLLYQPKLDLKQKITREQSTVSDEQFSTMVP